MKSESDFTDYEESEFEEEMKDGPIRRGLGKSTSELTPKHKKKRLYKVNSGEEELKHGDKTMVEENLPEIKHSQTIDSDFKPVQYLKKAIAEELTPRSNVSQYESNLSPMAKLGKYRWVRDAKSRKVSYDIRHDEFPSKEDKDSLLDEESIESKSSGSDIEFHSSKEDKAIPLKVQNNMKYVQVLRRSSILKKTLLGQMVSKSFSKISS